MTTYIIGDVHGCYDELQLLLQKINFCKKNDILIFTGDIINKGPKSLDTINFIMSLGNSAKIVLGNHEIFFLAISYNYSLFNNFNIFNDLINANNLKKIQHWLCNQKILITINSNIFISHAGIPHIWSPEIAIKKAKKVEFILKNIETRKLLLNGIIKNKYDKYSKKLNNIKEYLYILDYFTKMRIINKYGKLNIKFNSTIDKIPKNFYPWFTLKHKNFINKHKIIFGHWAAIEGKTKDNNLIALDTGCVFGGKLSCYSIEYDKKYTIKAFKKYKDI